MKLIIAHQPFIRRPNDQHGVKDCPVQGRLALEQWSEHGLNGLLHGHLHVPASYDLNQIYALGAAHPVWGYSCWNCNGQSPTREPCPTVLMSLMSR